jgi:hypothetical protein
MNTLQKNKYLAPTICKIKYTPLDFIELIMRGTSDFARIVQFITGKTWLDLYHTPGKTIFEQPLDIVSAGSLYNQKLQMFFPGLDISNLSDLFNMDYTEFILKLIFSSGDTYIIGTKENPIRFTDNWSTSNSGSIFTFSRKSIDKAYKLE